MLRRAVITVPGQGETECPRGGIPLCGVFRGCRRGRGIPCGWCAYGTVSFAADACFDPDDAVQDMAPFAAKQDDVARPQGADAARRRSRMAGAAGGCVQVGCRAGVSPESRVWRAVLALPSAARVSGTGSAGAPAAGTGAGAYFAIGVSTAMSRSLRSSGRILCPFMRIWTSCPSASIASTCSKKRRLVSSISGGCLGRRHRIPCGRRDGCRGIGQAFEVVDGDLRHDLGYEAADGVFQPLVVCERRRARRQQRPDGFDGTQAADAVLRCLRKPHDARYRMAYVAVTRGFAAPRRPAGENALQGGNRICRGSAAASAAPSGRSG